MKESVHRIVIVDNGYPETDIRINVGFRHWVKITQSIIAIIKNTNTIDLRVGLKIIW